MKPIIGINSGMFAGGPGELPALGCRSAYVDAVIAAGGVPVVLPPVPDQAAIQQHADLCDGYIFVGGPDINPARYGQEVHPMVGLAPERRENYDFALIRAVLDRRKPFLGVCMGCQEVNVVLGGTLIQDIASETDSTVPHYLKQAPHYTRQEVVVEPGTKMAEMVGGAGKLLANTAHHQAVGEPAPGIVISSRCESDGIVESFELADYPFGLAVQWHPEMLHDEEPHLNLFRGLVAAAREGALVETER